MSDDRITCSCACNTGDLPWAGRGTELDISGCRFSLYPMCDNYVPVILGALEATDTSAVWQETDALSTVYRGKLCYVADAVKALFINACHEGVHMAIEGQFSHGCPGDIDGDSVLGLEGPAPNGSRLSGKHFPVHCKIALYPMAVPEYIQKIAAVWRLAEERGLQPKTIHYATRLEGDVQDIFSFLEEICQLMSDDPSVPHYILHFTMNVNSPTEE